MGEPVIESTPHARDVAASSQHRSFKHRRGRITPGQSAALRDLWPRYGVNLTPTVLDLPALFGRVAPVALEIGFGMGETTLAMAAADPATDVLAIDVHTPGAGALLRRLDAGGIGNVRVIVGDAVDVLRDMVAPESLTEIRAFFPDPWPKARHHKRRLFSAAFIRLAASRLAPAGRLHVATDWADYAEQVMAAVADEPLLINPHDGPAPRPSWRPVTRFEQQGLARGHTIVDVIGMRRGVVS